LARGAGLGNNGDSIVNEGNMMTSAPERVLVTGAAGQLGSAFVQAFSDAGNHVLPLDRQGLDITDGERVGATVREFRPDLIVNCSAFNAVDAAETQISAAFAVNAHGAASLAAAAREIGAVMVHYSTDFVFDGKTSTPYDEEAPANPLSVYGASKLAGEDEVRQWDRHYILRVESLFGGSAKAGTRTTVDFLMESLSQGRTVRAALDRIVSPSYVPHVVRATLDLISGSVPFGTYHCVASGQSTWYELACEIARLVGAPPLVTPVSAADLPSVARRPQFCGLSNRKLRRVGIVMPTWRAALRAHVTARRRMIIGPARPAKTQVA
jgi:dTDP-4-dehydrorhamnose reductase